MSYHYLTLLYKRLCCWLVQRSKLERKPICARIAAQFYEFRWVYMYFERDNNLLNLAFSVVFNEIKHGLRTPRGSLFSKIRNFWAGAHKLGWNFMRHLGYFWPNYKHYFGTVSPLSMGKCSWFSFQKKLFRSKSYNSQMLPKYDIVRKEQRSHFRLWWFCTVNKKRMIKGKHFVIFI